MTIAVRARSSALKVKIRANSLSSTSIRLARVSSTSISANSSALTTKTSTSTATSTRTRRGSSTFNSRGAVGLAVKAMKRSQNFYETSSYYFCKTKYVSILTSLENMQYSQNRLRPGFPSTRKRSRLSRTSYQRRKSTCRTSW